MADDIGMDRDQMWNLVGGPPPVFGPPPQPAQPDGPPPAEAYWAEAKAPPAGYGPAAAEPRRDVHGRVFYDKGKAKGKGKNKAKGKNKDRRRPPLSDDQLVASAAAGAVNSRPPRWGAGECGACGGWYIPRMHVPGGGSGFCLSPPHVCLRSKIIKEQSNDTGRSCREIHEEYRRAHDEGAQAVPPWRDEATAAAWTEVLDAANEEAAPGQGRVPLILREAPARHDEAADASIGSNSHSGSVVSSGVTGVDLSADSEPEGVLDYQAEQDRRSRSPSADFTMSEHDKAVHEAKAEALDLIADTIRSWAQDMRDAASGQHKKIVESKFPKDLIDSILHSASALRGKHIHIMAAEGKSSEDIQSSVALQSASIMREVALMARRARKTNFITPQQEQQQQGKRGRSPTPPVSRRRKSPPAAPSGSRGIDKPAASDAPAQTTTKAPPAKPRQDAQHLDDAKEPKRSTKEKKKEDEKQRKRSSDKRQSASSLDVERRKDKKQPAPSSPSETPPRPKRIKRRRKSSKSPH